MTKEEYLLKLKFLEKENLLNTLKNSTTEKEIKYCYTRLEQIEIELLMKRIELLNGTPYKRLLKRLYQLLEILLNISMREMSNDSCNSEQAIITQFEKQEIYSQLDEMDKFFFKSKIKKLF